MARKCWYKYNKRCTNWSWNAQSNQKEDKKKKSRWIEQDKRREEDEESSDLRDSTDDQKGRRERKIKKIWGRFGLKGWMEMLKSCDFTVNH